MNVSQLPSQYSSSSSSSNYIYHPHPVDLVPQQRILKVQEVSFFQQPYLFFVTTIPFTLQPDPISF